MRNQQTANNLKTRKPFNGSRLLLFLAIIMACFIIHACTSSAGNELAQQPQAQTLPVISLSKHPAMIYQEFSATLEGSQDIEIRPKVDGYIDRIYIDEGTAVKQGQPLFLINDRPYREQLNNAKASLVAAKANQVNAEINVSKLEPLVAANVISEVQLKSAKAVYDAATASVNQAAALVNNAEINLGYTLIKAPADGYIGRIPFKTGSLVGVTTQNALTVLSSIKKIYAYFSFSEKDFLQFSDQFKGNTIEEKIKKLPEVELVLADNNIYPLKGKVETVSGQFDDQLGSISFRASFENSGGLLRSGNTGKIRIPKLVDTALIVPVESTFELQDKIFVFALTDSSKVVSTPIQVSGKSGNYYLVGTGITPDTKIVYSGFERLRDGVAIKPEPISVDSLLKSRPL